MQLAMVTQIFITFKISDNVCINSIFIMKLDKIMHNQIIIEPAHRISPTVHVISLRIQDLRIWGWSCTIIQQWIVSLLI